MSAPSKKSTPGETLFALAVGAAMVVAVGYFWGSGPLGSLQPPSESERVVDDTVAQLRAIGELRRQERLAPTTTAYLRDLDCVDFAGPVDVSGGDPYGLDADGDGWGCE